MIKYLIILVVGFLLGIVIVPIGIPYFGDIEVDFSSPEKDSLRLVIAKPIGLLMHASIVCMRVKRKESQE